MASGCIDMDPEQRKHRFQNARNRVMTSLMHRKAACTVLSFGLCFALLGLGSCGQTAPPVSTPAANDVQSYFGGPFVVTVNPVGRSSAAFDHSANQIAV